MTSCTCINMCSGIFKWVTFYFSGDATEITLQDLKPATEYLFKYVQDVISSY